MYTSLLVICYFIVEKRTILRKSGLRILPRPRVGRQELGVLLLDPMGEAI